MRIAALFSISLTLLAGAAAPAQQPTTTPATPQAQTTAQPAELTIIHAGTLLDRPGQMPRRNASIVVRGDRIERVEDGFVAVPTGVRLVDLRDSFVLPGLIDSHVHLDSDAGGEAGLVEAVRSSAGTAALRAAWNARKTLDAGFTTVRNLGDGDGATLALRDAVRQGWVQGPRIVDAGTSISTTGGHMDQLSGIADRFHAGLTEDNLCDGPETCRQAIRRQIRRGVDVIKIATTGGVNSGTGRARMAFDDETRALIETAHMYGRKVAVHAHGASGVNAALAAGADSIEHGTETDEESVRLFLRTRAFYVPTMSTVNGYIERLNADPNAYEPRVLEQIRWRIGITGQSLRRLHPAGVRIAFGTDAGVSKHGRNADEFLLMVQNGMSPMAAIVAATTNAAELLGLSNQVGSIQPGRAADIVAVHGDPLQDVGVLRNMRFVMANGRVHRLD